jgi:hypothetical protein
MSFFAIVSCRKSHYSWSIAPKSGFVVLLRAEIVSISEGITMATYWIVDGKQIPDEEYQEIRRREEMAREQSRQQAGALLMQLTDSYQELTQFMQQNPGIVQPVHSNAEQMQQAIYQKLRQNLQQADATPRCCWIKEDGTPCLSPKMRAKDYCFAHVQMYEAKPKNFRLPSAEDANGIQMAIMEVQRALIDDEISEKKAGLLLYSLQIASTNLERTTFGENPKEMVTDCVYEETPAEEPFTAEARQRGAKPTTEARRHGEEQVFMNTDDIGFGRTGKMLPRGALVGSEMQGQTASGA